MIKLIIDNSYSQITGITLEQMRGLKKVLSYKTESVFATYGNYPRIRYMIDAKGMFPSGLLKRVITHLNSQGLAWAADTSASLKTVTTVNHRPLKTKFEPYAAQTAAVLKASQIGKGIIEMPTGTGKSAVICMLIEKFALRTLVVVPNLGIKAQLIDTIKKCFGTLDHITVENIDSNVLQTASNYDMLIIDEAHHVAAKTYQKLNKIAWRKIGMRFFLTATPFRNNTEETLLMEGIAGPVIYRLSYKEAIKNGYIVPIEAYTITIPETKTDAYTWAEVYSELVVNNKYRNEKIAGMLETLSNGNLATLCLVKEIRHGETLSQMTGIPFANGQDENSKDYIRQFNNGGIMALIGTTGVLGEGIDSKPCEYVIIAGLGKAKSAFMQQVGRAVRKYQNKTSAKVILIKDKSHKFLLRHYTAQVKILETEYGVKPIKLET